MTELAPIIIEMETMDDAELDVVIDHVRLFGKCMIEFAGRTYEIREEALDADNLL